MICFATCMFGLESLVRDELVMMGAKNVRAQDARVFFEADKHMVIKANLWLRCADRVFVQLGVCRAETFVELFDGVRALDWAHLLPADAAFTVTGKSALSKLGSVRDVQSISKKAIADAMMAAHHYARCPENGQAYQVEIGLLRDEATIALNTSGAGLNRRGYRDLSAQAPLRETLGAALAMLSYYDGREMFVDPCCGSGTIVIEAAMIASKTAPGLKRSFAFDGWESWRQAAEQQREQAKAQRREGGFAHLLARDIDDKAVSMAYRHAKRAGVNGLINFACGDVAKLDLPAEQSLIVTNPPYGLRMDRAQGQKVARALGQLKQQRPHMGIFAISSDEGFEKDFGRKADKKRKLYNGNIKCNLYMYMRGRRKQPAD